MKPADFAALLGAGLDGYKIVTNSQQRAISCAELRINGSKLIFNKLTASELDYPLFVNILVGKRAECLIVIPTEDDDNFTIPFYSNEPLYTKTGRPKQRNCIEICDKSLAMSIRKERDWIDRGTKKIRGIRYKDRKALFFDLTKAEDSKKQSLVRPVATDNLLSSLPSLEDIIHDMVPVVRALPSPHSTALTGVVLSQSSASLH